MSDLDWQAASPIEHIYRHLLASGFIKPETEGSALLRTLAVDCLLIARGYGEAIKALEETA